MTFCVVWVLSGLPDSLSCLGLRGLTCWKVWDPDTCIIEWVNNLRSSLDTCMTAVRQLIVGSAINFQGYYKALWELAAFQKRQNPKSRRPGGLGFASRFASHWGAKQTASNPQSLQKKMEMLQISKCSYQPLQLCGQRDDYYFLIPLCPSNLPDGLLEQCHFNHLENHHLPLLPELGMWR